jgi:hypothetical protein
MIAAHCRRLGKFYNEGLALMYFVAFGLPQNTSTGRAYLVRCLNSGMSSAVQLSKSARSLEQGTNQTLRPGKSQLSEEQNLSDRVNLLNQSEMKSNIQKFRRS